MTQKCRLRPCLIGLLMPCAMVAAQSIPRATITGVVTDADTGRPLADVNVFIANTTWGAVTDTDGVYTLERIPYGTYELVASRMGYAYGALRVKLADAGHYNLALTPTVIELGELAVSSKRPKGWKKHLKKFKELFLGTSKNAKKTNLLNPEFLDFHEDKAADTFTATAVAPLHVVNEALGYRIELVLRDFQLHGPELRFTIKPRFEELTPKNDKQKKAWDEAREKAYRGSLRHFLVALARKEVTEQAFEVYRVPEPFFYYPRSWPAAGYYPDKKLAEAVDLDSLVAPGAVPYEKQLQFSEYLQVIYLGEKEDEQYLYTYPERRSLRGYQTSWIRLVDDTAVFDVLGHLEDAYSVIRQGYFFWEARMANMLPLDYGLSEIEAVQKHY